MFVWSELAAVATAGNIGYYVKLGETRSRYQRGSSSAPEVGGVDAPRTVLIAQKQSYVHTCQYIIVPIGADGAAPGCKPPASSLPACSKSPAR